MFLSGPYLQGFRVHEKFKWLRKAWQFQSLGCQVNLWVCIIGWLLFLGKDETAERRKIGINHFQCTEIDIFRVWIQTETEKKSAMCNTVPLNVLIRHRALITPASQVCMGTAEGFRVTLYPRDFPADFWLWATQAGRMFSAELRE